MDFWKQSHDVFIGYKTQLPSSFWSSSHSKVPKWSVWRFIPKKVAEVFVDIDILLISLSLEWSFKIFQKKQPCRENQLWTLVALKGKVTFLSTSSRKKRAVIVFGAVCKTNFPRFASSQELAVNGAGALIPQHLRHLHGNVCSSHRKSKDSSRVKGKSSSYLRSSRVSMGAYLKKKKVGPGRWCESLL